VRELRDCGAIERAADVRGWPPWKIRAALLWIDAAHMAAVGALDAHVDPPASLAEFLAQREGMRSCRVCGCTEDNACDDEALGSCCWVEANLCSSCHDGHDWRALLL